MQIDFQHDRTLQQMFQASIEQLGDGHLALFWSDRWHRDSSPCILAPHLCKLIRPKIRRRHTVAQALHQKQWIKDIVGFATVQALTEYVHLWHALTGVQLSPGVEDIVSWRWAPSGYTARSAYRAFFQGAIKFAAHKLVWRAWAPLKVKFFMWLAVKDRLWMAERRHRRGLQDHVACALCEQDTETSDNLFAQCSFTAQVWQAIVSLLNLQNQPSSQQLCITNFWLHLRSAVDTSKKRGIDSAFLLISWSIWRERNSRVFNRLRLNPMGSWLVRSPRKPFVVRRRS